ncbi:MAG: protein BatD, partial [Bacteroidales bacterium]|nr:protein BatD [Bacteroidales bacterium]
TIPPAEVSVDKKIYKSNSIKIEVIKGNVPRQQNPDNAAGMNQAQNTDDKNQTSSNELYLKILVNKTKVHREEYLIATIKLYTKVNIVNNGTFKLPTFEGFISEEINTPFEWIRENINGSIYNTGVLRKYILFPQKEGKITISASEFEVAYQRPSNKKTRSRFDDFFGSYDKLQKNLISNTVVIDVKPLPSNKPYKFSGAVGKLKLAASVDNSNVKTNDAISLKVKIYGSGNIKYINPLNIEFPTDFDVYDPKVNDNIKYSEKGAIGSKTFEYLMIPRHAGEVTIPAFNFSYFDTETDQFRTQKAGPFNISVSKSEGDTTITVSSVFTKEDVRFLGKDIRFIKKNETQLKRINQFLFGSREFYFAYIICIIMFIVVFMFRRKKIKENANLTLVKNKKANKFARKRLNKASSFMKQNEKESFYEELVKALWGFISDKLSIPIADLSKDNARSEMLSKNVDEEYIDQILDIIDRCEYARYAPTTEETKMDILYRDAIKVISKLQQKLK